MKTMFGQKRYLSPLLALCSRDIVSYIDLQEFESMEHFQRELIDYLDNYNDLRSKA